MDEKRSVIKMDFAWPYGQEAEDGLLSRPCVVVGSNEKGLFLSPVVTSPPTGDKAKYAVRLPAAILKSIGLKDAKAGWVRSEQLNFVERGSPAIHAVMLAGGQPSWSYGRVDEKLEERIVQSRAEAGRDGAQTLRKVATASLMGIAKDLSPGEVEAKNVPGRHDKAKPMISVHPQSLRSKPEEVVRRRAESRFVETKSLRPQLQPDRKSKTESKLGLVL